MGTARCSPDAEMPVTNHRIATAQNFFQNQRIEVSERKRSKTEQFVIFCKKPVWRTGWGCLWYHLHHLLWALHPPVELGVWLQPWGGGRAKRQGVCLHFGGAGCRGSGCDGEAATARCRGVSYCTSLSWGFDLVLTPYFFWKRKGGWFKQLLRRKTDNMVVYRRRPHHQPLKTGLHSV